MQAESILKSLSPIINNMRAFGLYFTRVSHVLTEAISLPVHRGIRASSNWNAGRVYATIMLVLMWLNAIRFCMVFDGKETLGAALLTKIISIPGALLPSVLHTVYYVASHTGSLDRVFCQGDLSTPELSLKYRCRAKVVMVVCWILVTLNVIIDAYWLFIYGTNSQLLLHLIKTFPIPKICVDIIKVGFVVLQLLFMVSWSFPQALKCISPISTQSAIWSNLFVKTKKQKCNATILYQYHIVSRIMHISSSNELPSNDFPLRSVQQVE